MAVSLVKPVVADPPTFNPFTADCVRSTGDTRSGRNSTAPSTGVGSHAGGDALLQPLPHPISLT